MEKVFLGVLANATDPKVILAVRGILDFIYYAHFEVHTDKSLAQLNAAWVAFHKNKSIFQDLEIQQHFNISKVHNIKHYLDSIRELGSAAGYNSEATERLHIDLVKVGYRASNKKAYIKQMTIWLCRQEAVERFDQYLQWAASRQTEKRARGNSGEEDSDECGSTDEGVNKHPQIRTTPTYHVTKKPAFPAVTVQSIITEYGAPNFLRHLTTFLHERSIPHSPLLSDSSTFPIYRHLYLSLPLIPEISTSNTIKDTILATKAERGRVTTSGIKHAVPG
ncbi:hypothetical protein H0H81_005760 [Sphagnurus paluster]|uniref:Uncharacterized protein n=1 Tax=Sphagnurus paluster TaxID=117069 RepID=A0A9P7K223_9AGAR|nr:hypothetical protein H0H81_005760 [Sphagnurus paluster]